eukprot:366143-Chlamydomonas_euryale.AAC.2
MSTLSPSRAPAHSPSAWLTNKKRAPARCSPRATPLSLAGPRPSALCLAQTAKNACTGRMWSACHAPLPRGAAPHAPAGCGPRATLHLPSATPLDGPARRAGPGAAAEAPCARRSPCAWPASPAPGTTRHGAARQLRPRHVVRTGDVTARVRQRVNGRLLLGRCWVEARKGRVAGVLLGRAMAPFRVH